MTGQKQHVELHRKLMLRRQLLKLHKPERIYVPFIGDGDIAAELYKGMEVYGADIDPERVRTASSRFPDCTIVPADCNRFPFGDKDVIFDGADFDAYSDPYEAFRSFWQSAKKADRLILFFTDGHKQGIIRSGTFITPDGEHRKLADNTEKREVFNFYFPRTILPWFARYIEPYKIVKNAFYLRGMMLYWGAVIDRNAPDKPLSLTAPADLKNVKFNRSTRKKYLDLLRQGVRRGAAAEQVGVTRQTVFIYKQKHPEFAEEERQAEIDACEIIEDALFQAAQAGNVRAIETWLFNRCPERWERKDTIKADLQHSGTLRIVFEEVGDARPDGQDDSDVPKVPNEQP